MPTLYARWVRDTRTGKDILVKPDEVYQYRDSTRYVRLDKPVPPDTPDAVKNVTRQKRRTSLKQPKQKAVKKAAPKKAAKK